VRIDEIEISTDDIIGFDIDQLLKTSETRVCVAYEI
jgi:hypothetical protein